VAKYNDKNEEIPDNTPVELPIGYKKPESLQEMIARMVNVHSQLAEREGRESFEEADDFDVEEDVDPISRYQLDPMQEEYIAPREEQKGEVSEKRDTELTKGREAETVKT